MQRDHPARIEIGGARQREDAVAPDRVPGDRIARVERQRGRARQIGRLLQVDRLAHHEARRLQHEELEQRAGPRRARQVHEARHLDVSATRVADPHHAVAVFDAGTTTAGSAFSTRCGSSKATSGRSIGMPAALASAPARAPGIAIERHLHPLPQQATREPCGSRLRRGMTHHARGVLEARAHAGRHALVAGMAPQLPRQLASHGPRAVPPPRRRPARERRPAPVRPAPQADRAGERAARHVRRQLRQRLRPRSRGLEKARRRAELPGLHQRGQHVHGARTQAARVRTRHHHVADARAHGKASGHARGVSRARRSPRRCVSISTS